MAAAQRPRSSLITNATASTEMGGRDKGWKRAKSAETSRSGCTACCLYAGVAAVSLKDTDDLLRSCTWVLGYNLEIPPFSPASSLLAVAVDSLPSLKVFCSDTASVSSAAVGRRIPFASINICSTVLLFRFVPLAAALLDSLPSVRYKLVNRSRFGIDIFRPAPPKLSFLPCRLSSMLVRDPQESLKLFLGGFQSSPAPPLSALCIPPEEMCLSNSVMLSALLLPASVDLALGM